MNRAFDQTGVFHFTGKSFLKQASGKTVRKRFLFVFSSVCLVLLLLSPFLFITSSKKPSNEEECSLFLKSIILNIVPNLPLQSSAEQGRLSSILVHDYDDSQVVRVCVRGFFPPSLTIKRGQSVMWSWRDAGMSEKHNIVHVNPPSSDVSATFIDELREDFLRKSLSSFSGASERYSGRSRLHQRPASANQQLLVHL